MNLQVSDPTAVKPTSIRYRVLAWFCSLSMITYIDRVCIMSVQDDIKRDLSLTSQEFAWVFSAFALAYALFEVPSGWLGDLLGPRKVLTRIVLCWLLFTALTGFVWGLVSLIVVRFLFGAGEAGAYPNMARGARNWFPYSERGRAQGLVWTFGRWGGAIAPILIVAIAYPFDALELLPGWRGAFFVLGVIGVFWVLGFAHYFRDTPQEHPHVNEAEHQLITGGVQARPRPTPLATQENSDVPGTSDLGSEQRPALAAASRPPLPPPLSWSSMLRSKSLWFLSIMYFCSNSGWSIFITYVTPYLKSAGLSGWELHVASGAPLFFGGIGCMLGGFLTDRQVRVWGRRWGRTLQGILAYALGGAFFLVAFAMTEVSIFIALAALCVASLLKDMAMGASWATTIDIGHRYSGTVAGVMNTIGNLGTVFSPPIVAVLVYYGDWAVSLYYYAAMFFIASVCWFFINPRKVIVYSRDDHQRLRAEGMLE